MRYTSESVEQLVEEFAQLPGIGKKLMWEILEARNKKPFTSFADISALINSIPHPEKMIQARILEELEDKDVKYHVFTSR